MAWGFETCGPNETLIVSGACHSLPKLVTGGRVFLWPFVQRIDRLSLTVITLTIVSSRIYSKLGVPITVTGVAQVKISTATEDILRRACENFVGRSQDEVKIIAKETLEGHQRAIIGLMTVEEIYQDRKKFSEAVYKVASTDFVNLGLEIRSYTLSDVRDDGGYLHALGLSRTARVKSEARIGEARARRDAAIRTAQAVKESEAVKYANNIQIALSKRDFDLQKAEYDKEIQMNKSISEMAYELQATKAQQQIKIEEMEAAVVERTRRIQVEDLEIQRQNNYLDATVRKPADAEHFRITKLAEADLQCEIAKAEGEAEAIKSRGTAKADALRARVRADANVMTKNALALEAYNDAAKWKMLLDCMTETVHATANPLNECENITIVSSGDASVVVSKLLGDVIKSAGLTTEFIRGLTDTDAFPMQSAGCARN